MNTSEFHKCGHVQGPMQVTFAESIDPISPTEHKITRLVVTKEEDEEKERTFGQKFAIPYALFRGHMFFSPFHARQSGFTERDHELFIRALLNMYDLDHSASRGEMHTQALFIFEHESSMGNAPAHRLLNLVDVRKKPGVSVARSFQDYDVSIDEESIPDKVKVYML